MDEGEELAVVVEVLLLRGGVARRVVGNHTFL